MYLSISSETSGTAIIDPLYHRPGRNYFLPLFVLYKICIDHFLKSNTPLQNLTFELCACVCLCMSIASITFQVSKGEYRLNLLVYESVVLNAEDESATFLRNFGKKLPSHK